MSTSKKFKVVLIGSSSVGKTSIVLRFSKGTFSAGQESTIGAAFLSRDIETETGMVSLHVWDTAGQERYRSLVPKYSQGASAIIIVFDVTDIESFEAAKQWLNDARNLHGGKVIWFLVANKIDMKPEFDLEKAKEFASSEGINYLETSAKTGENVNSLFHQIASLVPKLPPPPDSIDITETKTQKQEQQSGCC